MKFCKFVKNDMTLLSPYTQFYQVFRDFLVWYPSCAYAVFSSRTSTKIANFCSQFRENFPNTVILLVSLNIIL